MKRRFSALALGILIGATGLTHAAAVGSEATAAGPCRKVASANNDNIRLWYCNGTGGTARGYHAQAFMYHGSTLTLKSSSGAVLRSKYANISGVLANWYNTSTYGASSGGLYKACVGTLCTASGS